MASPKPAIAHTFRRFTLTRRGGNLHDAAGSEAMDGAVGSDLLDRDNTLRRRSRAVEVIGDSANGAGDSLAAITGAGHVPLIKPWPTKPVVPGVCISTEFTVDEAAGTVTCPAGQVRTITPSRSVTFGAACRSCPLRQRCTTSRGGRSLTLHEHDRLQRQQRQRAKDPQCQADYRQHRPMVERVARARRNRKVRYLGTTKNNHWLHNRTAGLNLRQLVNVGLDRSHGVWVVA